MTTVSKLGIQGIRSFDHERTEVLDFELPVTLIVGPNGSGKTTIIECLKMASCGALPPNARNGHGFIHDPAVAKLPEVKAQIRMLFRQGAGPAADREICAIRSFQLTNRRVAGRLRPQYKAIDSVLRTTAEDGTKPSLSHRCVDMDAQVPELMGVSKAVLENVIFCHQEDSSWPLQDSSTVKKRFDDIFGATRYTKALQNIKELQKEWLKTTRDRKADADLSQAHLDQASKLVNQKQEREKQAEEITAELNDLGSQIGQAEDMTKSAEADLGRYDSCGVRVAELRSLLERVGRDRDEITRSMQEKGQDIYREPLQELQDQLRQFQEKAMVEIEHKIRISKSNLSSGEADYHTAVDCARRLREDMGETLAAAEMLSSRKADLTARLAKANTQSVSALRERLDALSAQHSRAEREHRQREATSEEALASAERSLREATLEASRNEARAEDAQVVIRRLEEEAKTLTRSQPELDALVRAMRDNEAALGAEGSDARLRQLEKRQEEIGRRRHDLQYSISRKSSEVAQLEAQSDAHVEVDALRRRLREAESELGTRLGDARPRLVGLLGQMPEAADAEGQVIREYEKAQEQLKKQRQAVAEAHHRVSGASARRASIEADLRKLRADEQKLAQDLGLPSGGGQQSWASSKQEYVNRINQQREQVELARKDLAMTESAKHMYEKFREKSRSKNACQFCRRSFRADTEERHVFEESVEKLIVKIPQFLEESHRRLKDTQDELAKLEAQRPYWDRLDHLRHVDIANRQHELNKLIEEEKAATSAAEVPEREQKRLEDRCAQFNELRSEASALHRAAKAAEELRAAVRAREARLLGGNSKVSLQAERDQLRTLQEQLGELGREEDAVRTQRDLLAKQQESLRTQLAEQKGRLQLLQTQVARRGDVESELASRQAGLRDSVEAGRRARATADEVGARVQRLREERAEHLATFRRDVEAKDAEVRALQREVDSLTDLEQSIEVMRGRVENAEELKAKVASADEAVRVAERRLEGLRLEVEKDEERKRKREVVRECLRTNVQLKTLETEAQKHEEELAGLMQELGGRDLQALRQAVDNARARSMDLQRRKAFCEGSMAQTRDGIRALELELRSPLYQGVEQRHREAVIKHESAAYAAKDLGRYHAALDKALMKYHSMKMAEINKTIKELWRKVYRGRDIDYVAIRSDTDEVAEDGGTAETSTTRMGRSYNYRVVMVCGDAEMEMRGRCSAGQRVLASLIIRQALADSFCVHCGVLALDEPTTNLDAANIHGLAEALAALIEQRRGRSRFQLILITHDEDFVEHLSRLQVCDWFYHIHKDDKGCSKIDRREMRQLRGA
nr:DNA repair protein RAD50 [Crypthecodinium cohnii]